MVLPSQSGLLCRTVGSAAPGYRKKLASDPLQADFASTLASENFTTKEQDGKEIALAIETEAKRNERDRDTKGEGGGRKGDKGGKTNRFPGYTPRDNKADSSRQYEQRRPYDRNRDDANRNRDEGHTQRNENNTQRQRSHAPPRRPNNTYGPPQRNNQRRQQRK